MRLLLIEDEARIASGIKRALEQCRYAVDHVDNADDGLAAAVDPDYDLIILDRKLPGAIDGMQLCEQIRKDGVHTPVLMLTALGTVANKVEGLRAGADDYIVKPFSLDELIARVQVLLRRPKVTLGSIIQITDLFINTENYEVTRAGKTIKLSAREFRLLIYLAYHQSQIISKDTIINHVWDEDGFILPNTVEVYFGHLRKKIDKDFPLSPPLFHTVHGFGYRFGAGT